MSVIEDTARGGASAAESLFTRIGGEPAVNAAVEDLNGKINIITDIDIGSTFEISIPYLS